MTTVATPNLVGTSKYAPLTYIETGITAHAGGGQASAYQLTRQVSVIETVASGNDSVKLPKITNVPGRLGALGTKLVVSNLAAATAAKVFGSTPDTINNIATGTGLTLSAVTTIELYAVDYNQSTGVGRWVSLAQGSTGAQGAQGAQGPQGAQGAQGAQGPQG